MPQLTRLLLPIPILMSLFALLFSVTYVGANQLPLDTMPPVINRTPQEFSPEANLMVSEKRDLQGANLTTNNEEIDSAIKGTIKNESDEPLAGIRVTAYEQQANGSWLERESADTNANGEYEIKLVDTGLYRLRFLDLNQNYAFEYYRDALTLADSTDIPITGEIVPNIDAVLSAAGHITGQVTMFDHYLPSFGNVYIYHDEGVHGWQQIQQANLQISDGVASYDVGGLATGRYRLRVRAYYQGNYYYEYYNNAFHISSATDITVTAGSTTSNIDVPIKEGTGSITGIVRSLDETPLPDIEVKAYYGSRLFRSAKTDASGRYELVHLNGTYTVRFSDPAGTYATVTYPNSINVSNGETPTDINAALSLSTPAPTGRITGTLSMFDGMRPERAHVYLYRQNESQWQHYRSYQSWSSPSSYSFAQLDSGVYRICVRNGYYRGDYYDEECYDNASNVNSATDITITDAITTAGNINVVLGEPGAQIKGTVTSADSTALKDIYVTAYNGSSQARRMTTDSSGQYQLAGLDPGTYTVYFQDSAGNHAPEYYDNKLSVDQATPIILTTNQIMDDIDAELAPAGHITGSIAMVNGEAPDWTYLYLYREEDGEWKQVSGHRAVYNAGSYQLSGLATGTYRLHVRPRYQNQDYDEYYDNAADIESATDISVTSGSTTGDIEVIIGGRGHITGAVTGNGQPEAGIQVDLYKYDEGIGDWWRLVYAYTDAEGNYSIKGLKNGLYRVGFSDPSEGYATVYYPNQADLQSAESITISHEAISHEADMALNAAGSISGSITLTDSQPAEGISVIAYRDNGDTWEALGTSTSDATGHYTITGLLPGNYRLYFKDPAGTYRPQYYGNVSSLTDGTDVSVDINTVTPDINAILELPVPEVAEVTTEGSVVQNPNTGELTIMVPEYNPTDIIIETAAASCPGDTEPSNVGLQIDNDDTLPMSQSAPGVYTVTISANRITDEHHVELTFDCDNQTVPPLPIGTIQLYDPSGLIIDAVTGDPIEAATVTLYRVPNWLPDHGNETRNCRTVDTRGGSDWSNEPDADQEARDLGVIVNPEIGQINATPVISPSINPQLTDAAGRYGWEVVTGCWYVIVQADGYFSKTSPVVGVPPIVDDLDLKMQPLPVPPTPTPSNTPTPTATASATNTPTSTPTATASATNTPTSTPTATASATNTPTSTPTATASATNTPTSTPTATASATNTPTSTPTATASATNTPTSTPTSTPTATARATNTPTSTPTATASATNTPTSTPTPTPTTTSTPTTIPPNPSPEPEADLAVAISNWPNSAHVGDRITFVVRATNLGPNQATNVVFVNILPLGVSFVSATAEQGSCSHATHVVTCNLGTLGRDSSTTITMEAEASMVGTFTNQASLSSDMADNNSQNSNTTNSITISAAPTATATPISPTPTVTATPTLEIAREWQIDPTTVGRISWRDDSGSHISIEVPTGAVEEPITVRMMPTVPTSQPPNFLFAGVGFTLDAYQRDVQLADFTFNLPISVSITYTDTNVAGMNEHALVLHYWHEEREQWIDAATTCDPKSIYQREPEQNKVSVSICHFTEFALFASPEGDIPTAISLSHFQREMAPSRWILMMGAILGSLLLAWWQPVNNARK